MVGNSFGEAFRITTFGESHGEGVGVVVDGCPSGIRLSAEDFERDMGRRRPGRQELDTPRDEPDRVEILSGVFEGRTTGAPVALFIRNRDVDSKPYEVVRHLSGPAMPITHTSRNTAILISGEGAGRQPVRPPRELLRELWPGNF